MPGMKYNYVINVRDHEKLRASFNELTQTVYGFDFTDWYEKGHWGDKYIPHVLTDNGKVISNVSVNLMTFRVGGEIKHYIQLGTVMTDPEYRGQGLNKYLMEKILEKYQGTMDGIYLFANDSVLEYYPKFGFKPMSEYEYSCNMKQAGGAAGLSETSKYMLEKITISDKIESEKLYRTIRSYHSAESGSNPNDGFLMCDNLGLYQFWLAEAFGESVYYLPEMEAYVIANIESDVLEIVQIISRKMIDRKRLAASFKQEIAKVKLCYTPEKQDDYELKLRKAEDSTLFVMGDSLKCLETAKMMFPVISYA